MFLVLGRKFYLQQDKKKWPQIALGGLGEELRKSSQKGLFWKALEEAAQGMVESPFLEGFERHGDVALGTWISGDGGSAGDMAQG